MSVELVTSSTPELVQALSRLIPQLSRTAAPLDAPGVERLVSQQSVHLLAFRPDGPDGDGAGPILGMLSLAVFEIPTGLRAWIEDVVVDQAARGQGAGQRLVEAALAHARSLGCRTVDLTSRPSREAANRLYRRCGFVQRETNVYRFALES
ncbi:MAG: GNAT family N-acetyltransferase [Actinomyces sp.]|jgi:ribosomal protein S18 acetylase RimI-like enzyme|nr:GNAT family N-acetyltransferase [Actinomyces sp.]MCI1642383.1 GNAT family N-acetyltransferase [Actinomyces sp.]MCI1662959.1 GNAT family N-acetyltransferase [Actinomyces sp.]MCI1691553.1 GNAT family N-acetyltransferase [Actinomyces sp.]MCI1787153.1 GNAT family N-acetyltransferase [Actinomyces sp.]MCI1829547.1 GNAT family N-acetyltransferase [Actinomyces sp.]